MAEGAGPTRSRVAELREAFRDESVPLPSGVWFALAALLSLSFFLGLRLLVVRGAPARGAPAELGTPLPPAAAGTLGAARPDSSREAMERLVEGWRRAWQERDLRAYLSFYARSFGAQGKDLAQWADHKGKAFASDAPIQVEVSELQAAAGDEVVIVTFLQTYRSEGYEDRGRKRLYLLPEGGAWKIFNEDWEPE